MNAFTPTYALFLGEEHNEVVYDFTTDHNLYIIFTSNHADPDSIGGMIEDIKKAVTQAPNLTQIEKAIDTNLSIRSDQPFSFAAAVIRDNVLYLITRGEGVVYIRQSGKLQKLLSSRKSASGYIADGAFFALTSSQLVRILEKMAVDVQSSQQVVDQLKVALPKEEGKGAVGIFLSFTLSATEVLTNQDITDYSETTTSEPSSLKKRLRVISQLFVQDSSSRSKKLTLLVVLVLFIILVWSVGFGYQRRAAAERTRKIETAGVDIKKKLTEAEDLSTLNLQRAQELVAGAKQELVDLKTAIGDTDKKELAKLETLVTEKERAIFNTEKATEEVFYDLSLIKKEAKAQTMYLTADDLVLLNKDSGDVYKLSVSKKSVTPIHKSELRGADTIGVYEGDTFVLLKNSGIFKIGINQELKKVIEKDEKWSNVFDMAIFNGNIYLLDRGADEVYKYLVAQDGYSGIQSYFKGGQANLANSVSFTIDSSIYIAFPSKVYKYTSGLRDAFAVNLPNKDTAAFDGVFTNKESNSVYLLDTKAGKVYIVSKTGEYQRQIEAEIFKKALDFVVVEKSADPKKTGVLVLTGDKIYKVSLQ